MGLHFLQSCTLQETSGVAGGGGGKKAGRWAAGETPPPGANPAPARRQPSNPTSPPARPRDAADCMSSHKCLVECVKRRWGDPPGFSPLLFARRGCLVLFPETVSRRRLKRKKEEVGCGGFSLPFPRCWLGPRLKWRFCQSCKFLEIVEVNCFVRGGGEACLAGERQRELLGWVGGLA